MNRFPILRSRQRGAFMVDVTLALLISGIAIAAAMSTEITSRRLSFAMIQGDNLAMVREAAAKYASDRFTELQTGAAITGAVSMSPGTSEGNTYAPTVAQLSALGYLSPTFPAQSLFSNGATPGNYRITVARAPAGCEANVVTCDIEGTVYIDRAITVAGGTTPDGPAIASILSKLGGNGGASGMVRPQLLYFPNGETKPNPLGTATAGIVAARFGYGSSGLSNFVRINDSRNPNLQGNLTMQGDLKVVKTATAAAFLTDIKTTGTACAPEGAIGSAGTTAVICTGGTWQSLGDRANYGAACPIEGRVATANGTGDQLICKKGIYIRTLSLTPSSVVVGRATVRDLDTISKPTCDLGGTPDRSFSVTQISTDMTTTPPKQSMYLSTLDGGTYWQVVIRMRDDSGGEESGNTHGVTAVLNLECKY